MKRVVVTVELAGWWLNQEGEVLVIQGDNAFPKLVEGFSCDLSHPS